MSTDKTLKRVKLSHLVEHDYQMRTVYKPEPMASLVMQMIQNGFDASKRITVEAVKGDTKKFMIVRGHRRRIAWTITTKLLKAKSKSKWTLEEVVVCVNDLSNENGGLLNAAETLAKEFPQKTIPCVFFEGTPRQSVMALITDNYGREIPDILGLSVALNAARDQGVTVRELSQSIGKAESYVNAVVALGSVNPDLAKRLAEGELSLFLATYLSSLTKDKQEAVESYILDRSFSTLTVTSLRRAISLLKNFDGWQVGMIYEYQNRRNAARAFANLWRTKVAENPLSAYLAAFSMFHIDQDDAEPWTSVQLAKRWLAQLGEKVPAVWHDALLPYLNEIDCASCPIHNLPEKRLNEDLMSPALPCRTLKREQVKRCIHGLAASDGFTVVVPVSWIDLPGIQTGARPPKALSFDNLLEAYEAQREKEQAAETQAAETQAAETQAAETQAAETQAAETQAAETQAAETAVSGEGSAGNEKVGEAPTTPPQEDVKRPVDIMRGKLSDYIRLHVRHNVEHPMATPCSKCAHRIDDPEEGKVPCQVGSRYRVVSFSKIKAKGMKAIPVCRSFTPSSEYPPVELVPSHPSPPDSIDRNFILATIKMLADSRRHNENCMFEWLTGRPLNQTQRHQSWLTDLLDKEVGNLSDAQVYSLFLLAQTEWQRLTPFNRTEGFYLPTDKTLVTFVQGKSENWSL